MSGQRHELGPVDDRTAAHGDHEIDLLLADDFDGPQERVVLRVGLDAAELKDLALSEQLADLVDEPAALGAAAAIGDEDARVLRDLAGDLVNTALAEEDTGRVVDS